MIYSLQVLQGASINLPFVQVERARQLILFMLVAMDSRYGQVKMQGEGEKDLYIKH